MSVTVKVLFYNDHRQDERVKRAIEESESDHIVVITKGRMVENLRRDLIGYVDDSSYLFSRADDDVPGEFRYELLGGRLGTRKVVAVPVDIDSLENMGMERKLSWTIESFLRMEGLEDEQVVIGVDMNGANVQEAFAVSNVSAYIPMQVFNSKNKSERFPTIPRFVYLNKEQLDILTGFHLTFSKAEKMQPLSSSDISENTGKSKRNVDRALEVLRDNRLIEPTEAEKVRRSAGKIPVCYRITEKGRTVLFMNMRARGTIPYVENVREELENTVHHHSPKKDI